MIKLHQLNQDIAFPAIDYALDEPNGLLAFGGDLSVDRLYHAYQQGIFPWYSEGEPILWWSPDPRGILRLDDFHVSRSLRKLIRQRKYSVTLNQAFDQVISECAQIPRQDNGTWITPTMVRAYKKLHREGLCHSVEVWQADRLVGGLYGVAVGRVFCGESMFSRVPNASKLAFFYLIELMRSTDAHFIDCQMQNPHLASFGCSEVKRELFLTMLAQERRISLPSTHWLTRRLSE